MPLCLPGCNGREGSRHETAWADVLLCGDVVDTRIAQAYLARAGSESLEELDALSVGADAELAERLQEVTSLMLLNTVSWSDLGAAPNLKALSRERFDSARRLARTLAGAERYETGEFGMTPVRPPTPAARVTFLEIISHGGWAVPAALELCADESPSSRLYGAMILVRLEAWGQLDTLHHMLDDDGAVSLDRGCFIESTTVGGALAMRLKNISTYLSLCDPDHPYRITFEAEAYLRRLDFYEHGPTPPGDPYAATNESRKQGGTMEATSWDDFWRRSRPVLAELWDQ